MMCIIFLFQGKSKGQLALSAYQASSQKRPSSNSASKSAAGGHSLNLKDRLTQQLVTSQAECMGESFFCKNPPSERILSYCLEPVFCKKQQKKFLTSYWFVE